MSGKKKQGALEASGPAAEGAARSGCGAAGSRAPAL